MRKLQAIAICLVLLFSLCQPASAQQAAASTLSGRIVDPQGALIVGAKITATQKSTGLQREVESNSEGLYTITNLPPGDYEVKVQAKGFKSVNFASIELQVGQVVARNLNL
jgi:hypothetical protein